MSNQATFLMGDLDRIFSVLFEMGEVENVLHRDWKPLYKRMMVLWPEVSQAITTVNGLNHRKELRAYFETLRRDVLESLVIEVAREMADYYGVEAAELH